MTRPCSGCGLTLCDGRCYFGEDESDHECPRFVMCPECWSIPIGELGLTQVHGDPLLAMPSARAASLRPQPATPFSRSGIAIARSAV
jgi:hypothetical protein